MRTLTRAAIALALSLLSSSAWTQTTTGTISGRITDAQGAPLENVLVRARSATTGFEREDRTDRSGTYHLSILPVGSYDVTAELSGFRTFIAPATTVNVGREVTLDIKMQVVARAENVTVSAAAPLVSTRSSAVGAVVDLTQIEGLPLNGRQFANLAAATVPGVGLGFHTDVSKAWQFTPQVSGGNGRNFNYIIDGGDNNDDTVGGLLQAYPLESIAEFNVFTQRFDAEYGRSNGGVFNVVTKSGTNELRGSWFTLLRDEGLNARAFREKVFDTDKQPYSRYQYGGSVGGPLRRDRAHFFAAFERTQQDTKQIVSTLGAFPADDGIFDVTFRENLFTGKVTATFGPRQHASLRYSRDKNRQPAGVTATTAHSAWATSTNTFDSLNLNHNWIAASALVNEVVVQYSDFVNDIPANSSGPSLFLQANVRGGTSAIAPQRTEQIKVHFRDDLSWTLGGGPGLAHEIRTGVSWVHEPRLRAFAGSLTQGLYMMPTLDPSGVVTSVQVIGGSATANFPSEQFGIYAQDDWRVTERLTLNLGLRWDYTNGVPIDQSRSPNFLAMQEAARAGVFAGTFLDEFREDPRSDRDNLQPRLGAVLDLFGDGGDVLRGGWGLYTDLGYTAANVLIAAFEAGGSGTVFFAADGTGLKKLDGTLFGVGDPLNTIAHLNLVPSGFIPTGEVVSPVLEQPYTWQANIGWSHQLSASTIITADYVRVDGRNLSVRLRPNVFINGVPALGPAHIVPNSTQFRTAVSQGSSRYDGLIVAARRRLSRGVDATASYTLSKATTDVGTAYDEIIQSLMQDIRDPFGPVQQGPALRTDSRHAISVSAIVQVPWRVNVAPILYYRSALPVHTFEGIDRNSDGIINDRTATAYRYTGMSSTGVVTYAEDGPCRTINCSRRAPFSQLNLRISRSFALGGGARIEAIGEVYNLFNAVNPVLALTQQQNSMFFMQVASYAGDVGQSEQRVGQVGFRFTF